MTGMIPPAACPAEEVLKAYVDGELSTEEQSTVRTHLDGCSTCAGEVEVMKIIGSELRGLEGAVEPPARLRGRILSRIDFTPERRRRSGLGFLRWASLAAAAVVVLFVAYDLTPSAKESARTTSTNSALKQFAAAPSAPASADAVQLSQRARTAGGGMPSAQDYDDGGRRNGDPYPFAVPTDPATVNGAVTGYAPGMAAGRPPASRFDANGTTSGDDRPFSSIATMHVPDGQSKAAGGGIMSGLSPKPGIDFTGGTVVAGSRQAPGQKGDTTVSDVDRYARGKLDGPVSRKVFQSADLSVRIDRKLESAQDEIAGHLKKLGGYVEESSLSSPEGTPERVADMVLRAPVDQFETTLSWLSGLGDVTAKSLSGKDVTSRWVDERAVLREMRKEETRLSKELDQAKKPAVIQGLRWQLLRLRPRIAAAEDQFAATSKLAALATIRLKLLERPEARVRGNLLDDMGRTTHTAWAAFLVALRVPASILIWLAVFAPLWLPCLLVYRWATKKLDEERRRTRAEVYSADPAV